MSIILANFGKYAICDCRFILFVQKSMMTSSNGNIFRVTGHFCGEFTGEFPAQRPVTRSFGVFFDLGLNKRLSKQSRGWWFQTQSRPLWRHCNAMFLSLRPSHYLNQCRFIDNWTPKNKLRLYLNENTMTFIHENALENVVSKMSAIMFRTRCAKWWEYQLALIPNPISSLVHESQ